MALLTKIQYVFNKILLNLLKEIKDKNTDLKKKIKENYAVFDKSSESHIQFFIDNINDDLVYKAPYDEKDILTVETVLTFEILKNIKVADILNIIDEGEREVIKCYLYILYMLSYIHKKTSTLNDEDVNELTQMNELFTKCMKMIKKEGDLSYEDEMDNIIDDDLCIIFKNIYESRKHIKDSMMSYNNEELDGKEEDASPFDFLRNSKIGQLAQEITHDIDIDKLNIKDPSELLNIESMFSGDNNVLGDIISKVGNKVAAKISSGELKHEDLLSEAMSMMSKLNMGGGGGNPFMEEMMKSAMNSQNGAGFDRGPDLNQKRRNSKKKKK
jgi:hypothetical protein